MIASRIGMYLTTLFSDMTYFQSAEYADYGEE